jgi:hypothetical protein
VQLDRRRIAHQQRPADFLHGGVESGLEAHLRPDAGRVSGGDGDARQCVGGQGKAPYRALVGY